MKILSLNKSLPSNQVLEGKKFFTSIRKIPVNEVNVTKLGIDGDGVGNRDRHGGEDKALCVFGHHHYKYFDQSLNLHLPIPSFGENLTLDFWPEDIVRMGDIYTIGSEVVVQVSDLRYPCKTLSASLGDPRIIPLLKKDVRVGCYLKVLTEGTLRVNDQVTLNVRSSGESIRDLVMKAS